MAKKKAEEKINLDSILFKCRDILRQARNSGSFFEKRDMMLTLVFLRFIGEKFEDLLTDENLALLKDADIALVPVGGVYTYDMFEALELIDRTTPKLAIPMHFRSEIAGFGLPNIDSLEKFMDTAAGKGKKVGISRVSFINTGDIELGSDILVLRPQNF